MSARNAFVTLAAILVGRANLSDAAAARCQYKEIATEMTTTATLVPWRCAAAHNTRTKTPEDRAVLPGEVKWYCGDDDNDLYNVFRDSQVEKLPASADQSRDARIA